MASIKKLRKPEKELTKPEPKNKVINDKNADRITITEQILSKDQAVDQKVAQLQTKVFGMSTTKFQIESIKKVHIPYCFYIYDYEINRKTFINRSGKLDKRGQVAVVFDLNEVHPFEYDLGDEDRLILKQSSKTNLEGEFLKSQCSDSEADDTVLFRIQNKILRRVYGTTGDLKLVKRTDFYRPAWQLEIKYKKSDITNVRYAYADNYAVQNEHILGLKFRLDGR